MKQPHVTRGYSLHTQELVTKRVKAALITMGFEVAKLETETPAGIGDLIFTKIHEVYKVGILVRPPDFSKLPHSWMIQVEHPDHLLRVAGQTSFSAKWATPEKVMGVIFEKLANELQGRGRAEIRCKVHGIVKEFENL